MCLGVTVSSKGLATDPLHLDQASLVTEQEPACQNSSPCAYRDPGVTESLLDCESLPKWRSENSDDPWEAESRSLHSHSFQTCFLASFNHCHQIRIIGMQRWMGDWLHLLNTRESSPGKPLNKMTLYKPSSLVPGLQGPTPHYWRVLNALHCENFGLCFPVCLPDLFSALPCPVPRWGNPSYHLPFNNETRHCTLEDPTLCLSEVYRIKRTWPSRMWGPCPHLRSSILWAPAPSNSLPISFDHTPMGLTLSPEEGVALAGLLFSYCSDPSGLDTLPTPVLNRLENHAPFL